MNWKRIDFDKIAGESKVDGYFGAITRYNFNSIVNYNKDIFMMLGDDSGEKRDEHSGIVYSTQDFGNNWKKTVFGKGTVKEGLFVGKDAFLVSDTNKNPTAVGRKSILYHSKNFGNSWQEIFQLSNGNLSNIDFVSSLVGIALFSETLNDNLVMRYMKTSDGGKNWEEINLDPETKCILKDENTVWFFQEDELFAYDLEKNSVSSIKRLDMDPMMDIAYFKRDRKTNEIIAYFFSKNPGDKTIVLYNCDQNIKTDLPPGYYITTYGNFYFGLLYDSPHSTYVISRNYGKSWEAKKLKNIIIHSDIPTGYSEEGYLYIEGTPVSEQGTFLMIGHPKQ